MIKAIKEEIALRIEAGPYHDGFRKNLYLALETAETKGDLTMLTRTMNHLESCYRNGTINNNDQ